MSSHYNHLEKRRDTCYLGTPKNITITVNPKGFVLAYGHESFRGLLAEIYAGNWDKFENMTPEQTLMELQALIKVRITESQV